MHAWLGRVDRLQNNNDRQTSRPGPNGRPNGQTTPPRSSNSLNKWLILIVGVMLIVYIYNYFNQVVSTNNAANRVELTYTQFLQQVDAGNVKDATLTGTSDITGNLVRSIPGNSNKATQYHVYQLPYPDSGLADRLRNHHVQFTAQNPPDNTIWLNLLIGVLPWLFLFGAIIFFSRRASQGQQGIFSFGK